MKKVIDKNVVKNSFVQFLTSQIRKNLEKTICFSRIKIGRLIYKRVPLYHIMTRLHSISTKVIPIHIFVNGFANFNPRINRFFKVALKPRKCKNIS